MQVLLSLREESCLLRQWLIAVQPMIGKASKSITRAFGLQILTMIYDDVHDRRSPA